MAAVRRNNTQGSFADLLGEGVNELPQAPDTNPANQEANPNNPQGLSDFDIQNRRDLIAAQGQATAATNAGVGGGLGSNSDAAIVARSNVADFPTSGIADIYGYGPTGDAGLLRAAGVDPRGGGNRKTVVVQRNTPEWEDAFALENPQFNVNELGIADPRNPNANRNVANGAAQGAKTGSSAGPYGALIGAGVGGFEQALDEFSAQGQQLGLTAQSDDELRAQGYSQSMIDDYRARFGAPGSPGTAQSPVQTAEQVTARGNAAPAGGQAAAGALPPELSSAALMGRGVGAVDAARARSQGALAGTAAPTNPGDRTLQLGAINSAAAIRNGPRAVDTATGANNAMLTGPRAVDTATGQNNAFISGPRATDAATGSVQQFQQGPRAQSGVMGQIDQYLDLGEGPSKAQILLDQANQDAMSDVLSVSRSGRARDAGSQARQAAVAQGEIAGMGVDNARDAGLLRAQETQDSLVRGLQALDTKAGLATSLDTGTLEALGLESTLAGQRDTNTVGALGNVSTLAGQRDITSADLLRNNSDLAKSRDETGLRATELEGKMATDIRNAGVQERDDTLSYGLGQDQIEQGLLADLARESGRQETSAADLRQRQATELTLAEKRRLAEMAAQGQMFEKGGELISDLLEDEDE